MITHVKTAKYSVGTMQYFARLHVSRYRGHDTILIAIQSYYILTEYSVNR